MDTNHILTLENVLSEKECVICYHKFIDVKLVDYSNFLNTITSKYNLNNSMFEDDTMCLCYDDRFECLTCKNIVCCGCIMSMPDVKHGTQRDSFAEFCNGYTEEVFEVLDMNQTGIVTCPVCITKDYRLLYTRKPRGVIPEEIIYEIKRLRVH